MSNGRRAGLVIVLSLVFFALLGWLLGQSWVKIGFLLLGFIILSAAMFWYAASKGGPQISGRQSLAVFGRYLKNMRYYLAILLLPIASFIRTGNYNAYFSLLVLANVLLTFYILSSYGIEPAQKGAGPWKSSK